MKKQILLGIFLGVMAWHAPTMAMKTIEVSEKPASALNDQDKMNLAQSHANKGEWIAVFDIMYPMALAGNVQAQGNVGMLYNLGRGVAQDQEKAYWWFSEAAERGSVKAINNLAVMYYQGTYVKQDTAQAIKLFEKTASVNDTGAMMMLGEIYQKQNNDKKSFEWVKKAADLGNEEAKLRIAYCYELGIGTMRNTSLATLMYRELLTNGKDDTLKNEAKKRLANLAR